MNDILNDDKTILPETLQVQHVLKMIRRKAFLLRGIACHLKRHFVQNTCKKYFYCYRKNMSSCLVHFYECKSSSW